MMLLKKGIIAVNEIDQLKRYLLKTTNKHVNRTALNNYILPENEKETIQTKLIE